MPDNTPNPRIFISYAHKDGREVARKLRVDLLTRGYDLWQKSLRR